VINTGYTQKNCVVSKVNKKLFFSSYTGETYTVSRGKCPSFSCATSSSLLMLTAGQRGQFLRWSCSRKKVFRVLCFEVPRYVITVQRNFSARFRKDAPCRNNITGWYRQFVETGCLCKGKNPGRPRVSDDNIERLFSRSSSGARRKAGGSSCKMSVMFFLIVTTNETSKQHLKKS
jgi:uncharacterized membrane protein (UPF0136 family)